MYVLLLYLVWVIFEKYLKRHCYSINRNRNFKSTLSKYVLDIICHISKSTYILTMLFLGLMHACIIVIFGLSIWRGIVIQLTGITTLSQTFPKVVLLLYFHLYQTMCTPTTPDMERLIWSAVGGRLYDWNPKPIKVTHWRLGWCQNGRAFNHFLINQPLCCRWLIWPIQIDAKKLKNDWNPGTWVLIWEYSARPN